MKKKIVALNTLVLSFALLIMFVVGAFLNREAIYSEAKSNLISMTEVCAANYDENTKVLTINNKDVRETIINKDGVVLLDSDEKDVSNLENHLNREEIQNALNNVPSVVVRHSSTLDIDMMYYAIKVDTSSSYIFVRLAMKIANINNYVYSYLPYFISIYIFLVLISILMIFYISKISIKPLESVRKDLSDINNGNYHPSVPTTKDDSVNKIIVEINSLDSKLNDSLETSKKEKEQLDYVLNNISDGIMVFNSSLNILLINKVANKIFNLNNIVGKNAKFITNDEKFINNLNNVNINSKPLLFELAINNSYFLTSLNKTGDGLIIAVLTNITYEKKEENLRAEFFSNASHELKTPLTSIKGFNDLISLNNNDEKINKYTSKIEEESNRMLALIDDMMNLSKLENKKVLNKVDLDCKDIMSEVIASLEVLKNQKEVKIEVIGDFHLQMEKDDLFKLLKNLVENSIKYNNQKGLVKVSFIENDKLKTIEVSDNGYGIPLKDQSRVFERFYRVDESRARDTGGTGLGLAIVKHIAQLYNAEIKLSSKEEVGTTIQIIFNL